MQFNQRYFLFAVVLFIIEVLIALYVKDAIIRPYGGDFLVVILLYYLVRTFWNGPTFQVALGVLLFAYTVEILQYLKIVDILGLTGNRLAEIVIGTGFSWWDMVAYTLGIIVVYFIDK
ncbi:MAG: DUF2809 domain-containing protein [Saprospiraceae bacterium]